MVDSTMQLIDKKSRGSIGQCAGAEGVGGAEGIPRRGTCDRGIWTLGVRSEHNFAPDTATRDLAIA